MFFFVVECHLVLANNSYFKLICVQFFPYINLYNLVLHYELIIFLSFPLVQPC